MPPCLCVMAIAATLIDKARVPTLGSSIHLYVPHSGFALLIHSQDITSSQETTSSQDTNICSLTSSQDTSS